MTHPTFAGLRLAFALSLASSALAGCAEPKASPDEPVAEDASELRASAAANQAAEKVFTRANATAGGYVLDVCHSYGTGTKIVMTTIIPDGDHGQNAVVQVRIQSPAQTIELVVPATVDHVISRAGTEFELALALDGKPHRLFAMEDGPYLTTPDGDIPMRCRF